jgi:hypothetical protein
LQNATSPSRARSGAKAVPLARLAALGWPAALSCALLTVLLAALQLRDPPYFDELYTLLAARGWHATGSPVIGSGVYERAEGFTILVAAAFALLGESLAVARLPALLATVLLVAVAVLWTRRVAGAGAAWIAGLLLALDPLTVQMAAFARFYGPHALVFFLGAIALHAALVERPGRVATALLLAAAALLLALAHHFQILTVIGLAGLGLWLALAVALPGLWALRDRTGRLALALALLAALLLAALLLLALSGQAEALLRRFRAVPLHSAQFQDAVWYYHLLLTERYPTLWPLTPFLALYALAVRPRPALLALCVLATSFALLSLAGHKALRFFFFVLPFLAVLWGIALAGLVGPLWRAAGAAVQGGLRALDPALDRGFLRKAVLGLGLVFLVLAHGAPARTLLIPLGVRLQPTLTDIDWTPAVALLEGPVRDAGLVVTTHELHALYHLGRAEVILSRSRLQEFDGREFERDPRTGLPTIAGAPALARLIACHADGVLLTDTVSWGRPDVLAPPLVELVLARMTPLPTPEGSRVLAFAWRSEAPPPAGLDCPALRPQEAEG